MSASRNRFCFMLFVMTVAVGVTADGLLAAAQQEKEKTTGFKPLFIRQGDGQGGWKVNEAQCQQLRYHQRGWSAGFGITQMEKSCCLGYATSGKACGVMELERASRPSSLSAKIMATRGHPLGESVNRLGGQSC